MSDQGDDIDPDQPVDEEEVEKPPFHFEIVRRVNKEEDRARVHDIIRGGLSQIGKSHNQSGYAYTNLDIKEKKVADLYDLIPNYQHLRIGDLSKNAIVDVSTLNQIPYLLDLNLSSNKVATLMPFTDSQKLQFLQTLNLSNNKLTGLEAIELPKLRKLNLSANQIESCEKLNGHPTLEALDIKGNKLKNLKGIERMPNLKDLDASENQINNIDDLNKLPALKNLLLNKNKMTGFNSPLPVLQSINFLNVATNKMKNPKELEKLREWKSLRNLDIVENRIADDFGGETKKEVLMILPQLTKVGEEDVEEEDRKDALETLRQRLEAEEEARQEAERIRKEEEEERLRLAEEERIRLEEEEAERLRLEAEEKERLEAEEREKLEADAKANGGDDGGDGDDDDG